MATIEPIYDPASAHAAHAARVDALEAWLFPAPDILAHLLPSEEKAMHPEERGLLDAIIDAPADDAPRLIYADWLEDAGREERAEFIRVQIERTKKYIDKAAIRRGLAGDVDGARMLQAIHEKTWADNLRDREDALVRLHAWKWLRDELPPAVWQEYDRWENKGGLIRSKRDDEQHVEYRRGMLAAVRLPLRDWTRHGPALVKAHPVEDVSPSALNVDYRGPVGRGPGRVSVAARGLAFTIELHDGRAEMASSQIVHADDVTDVLEWLIHERCLRACEEWRVGQSIFVGIRPAVGRAMLAWAREEAGLTRRG